MSPEIIRVADVARLLGGCPPDDIRDVAEAVRRATALAVEGACVTPFAAYLGGLDSSADATLASVADMLCVNPTTVARWKSLLESEPASEPNKRDHLVAYAAKYCEFSGVSTGGRVDQGERNVDRLSARLQLLIQLEQLRWPPPSPPAGDALAPHEWRYLTATFLIDDALAKPGDVFEERMCEDATDEPSTAERAGIRRRLERIYSRIGSHYPSLADVVVPPDRWGDLYRRLLLPWLVLVWMSRYPVHQWATEPSNPQPPPAAESSRNAHRPTPR